MLYTFLAGVGIMIVSLIGVLFVSKKAESLVSKNLPYLISFSAGVFLFTTGFMIMEGYHIFESVFVVGALVLAGYIGAYLTSKLLPKLHHHHDDCCDGHESAGKNVLVADGIHNIADGMILVPAFMISPVLGFATALSLVVHESLQEISEYFVLRHAGYSTGKALLANFLTSSTILIGIILGFIFVQTVAVQGVLLCLAAGFFAYILSHDLIPHKHTHHPISETIKHTLIILTGVLLIGGINALALGEHSHDHGTFVEHEEHDDEEHHDEEHHDEEHHDEEHHDEEHL